MNLTEAKKILELPDNWENGDLSSLKKKYHILAKKYHPDKCKDPDANAEFIKINQAYEYLQNPPDVIQDAFNFDFNTIASLLKSFGMMFPGGMEVPPKQGNAKEIKITPIKTIPYMTTYSILALSLR